MGRLAFANLAKSPLRGVAMRVPEHDGFDSVEDKEMGEAYRRMANDAEHEREAQEWCEALIGDATD
jgi:hypothetical protein